MNEFNYYLEIVTREYYEESGLKNKFITFIKKVGGKIFPEKTSEEQVMQKTETTLDKLMDKFGIKTLEDLKKLLESFRSEIHKQQKTGKYTEEDEKDDDDDDDIKRQMKSSWFNLLRSSFAFWPALQVWLVLDRFVGSGLDTGALTMGDKNKLMIYIPLFILVAGVDSFIYFISKKIKNKKAKKIEKTPKERKKEFKLV